jgi:hypothetical protein
MFRNRLHPAVLRRSAVGILPLIVSAAAGCLPIPHTSERFPAMQGRVVDETTGQPIAGAVVAIHEHPSTTAKTDSTGDFHVPRKVNFHLLLGLGPCPNDWPEGVEWSWVLDVTHAGYQPRQIDANNQLRQPIPNCSTNEKSPLELRDIALRPTTRASPQASVHAHQERKPISDAPAN